MSKKRVRIIDVAKAAGVSPGTVDRVIHQRGGVRKEIEKRIRVVMEELDYRPNIIARTLANNKVVKIAALVPDYQQDAFWEEPRKGIKQGLKAFQHFSIDIRFYFYNNSGRSFFLKKAQQINPQQFDGLIIAPLFAEEAREILAAFEAEHKPVVFINTNLNWEPGLCYVGQDSYQSGRLAAKLLSYQHAGKATFLLCHLEADENTLNSAHLRQKEKGFLDFFEENYPDIAVFVKQYDKKSEPTIQTFLQKLVREFPAPSGICVSTSRAYQLLEAVGNELQQTTIVGFDLLPENVAFLKSGKITFLINQNPQKQGYRAVENLVNYLFLKKKPPKVQHLPLDIIVKENVDGYLAG